MLHGNNFPSFVGKLPFRKYELLMKYIGDNQLLCKMCYIIENGGDIVNPISHFIDKEEFAKLSPENQQRLVFRLSKAYIAVKKLYGEMEEERKFG